MWLALDSLRHFLSVVRCGTIRRIDQRWLFKQHLSAALQGIRSLARVSLGRRGCLTIDLGQRLITLHAFLICKASRETLHTAWWSHATVLTSHLSELGVLNQLIVHVHQLVDLLFHLIWVSASRCANSRWLEVVLRFSCTNRLLHHALERWVGKLSLVRLISELSSPLEHDAGHARQLRGRTTVSEKQAKVVLAVIIHVALIHRWATYKRVGCYIVVSHTWLVWSVVLMAMCVAALIVVQEAWIVKWVLSGGMTTQMTWIMRVLNLR